LNTKLDALHPTTLYFMHSLGQTYLVVDRTGDGISLLEETLKRSKQALEPDHPDLIFRMSDLGYAYRQAGRVGDAVPLQEETLELAKKRFGADHPRTLNFMNKVAKSYLELKRLGDAETVCRECLRLHQAKQQSDWARFLTMSLLGAALAEQKRYAEAEPLLQSGIVPSMIGARTTCPLHLNMAEWRWSTRSASSRRV
jgi:tetratricopeptide (TPR) repeat protein